MAKSLEGFPPHDPLAQGYGEVPTSTGNEEEKFLCPPYAADHTSLGESRVLTVV